MEYEDKKREIAEKRVKSLKKFYSILIWYAVINIMLFVINFFTSPGSWWFLWVTIFWGIGLIFMFAKMFILSDIGFFGKKWEDKKIKEYMEQDK